MGILWNSTQNSNIESRYPWELLTHVQETRGYTVEENSPGIYTVVGDRSP